jgi:hypothetical protein
MRNLQFRKSTRAGIAVLILLAFILVAGSAFAQVPPEKKTVFTVANKGSGFFPFPMRAYAVDADQLIFAEQWNSIDRGIGAVGLAVDEGNKNLFISYESSNKIEIYNAETAVHQGRIVLQGTSNLAGMVVHQDRGHLYVVDRGEKTIFVFDTSTFAAVETWILPTGIGPWGIDLLEEELYCADTTSTVRWYNIDAQTETGSATLPRNATGIAVTDYPETAIYTADPWAHHYISKYTVSSGLTDSANMGDNGMGIALNPALGLVYHVVGHGGSNQVGLYVLDAETLSTIHRYNFPLKAWGPSDLVATFLEFGGTVDKTSPSHPSGVVGATKEITFELKVENRNAKPIHFLPLKDTYDVTQLSFVSATPASDDNIDDGEIDWGDLIATFGADLPSGQSYTVEAIFLADPDVCETFVEGVNVGQMIGAEDVDGAPLPDAAGTFSYTINCYCTTDAECDDGLFCNGVEFCNEEGECESPGNPCPLDDDIWCNGIETAACDEAIDECGHYAAPCEDDGVFCNGEESCDEENETCPSSGNPCSDDGVYCNGAESCNEKADQCASSGDPCPPDKGCVETTESCGDIDVEDPDDDDDTDPNAGDPDEDEELWPEGEVTGGCCGC